jgi:hypothetical protein
MTAGILKQPPGRPSKDQRGQARRIARQKRRVAELFEHRHLFVGHHLSAAQRQLLHKLTRGLPQLRTLREIMEEVYRLFDRRCKTQTALKKLERLRRRVRRFQKLWKGLNKLKSPTLEKALVFLDDRLLGATSNAVERANRRFRKAQQSIYSVRTKEHVEQRLALDMQREQRTPKRQQTAETLHRARSKPGSLHETCYSIKQAEMKIFTTFTDVLTGRLLTPRPLPAGGAAGAGDGPAGNRAVASLDGGGIGPGRSGAGGAKEDAHHAGNAWSTRGFATACQPQAAEQGSCHRPRRMV